MAQQIINYGNTANDGTGDPLRDAFIKVDENFNQIWAAGPVGSNITILNNTVGVTDTNGNLILSPNGVGVVQNNGPFVPRLTNTYGLGTANLKWRSLSIGAGGIDVSGNINLASISNLRIAGGTNGYVIQTDGAGNLSWVAQAGTGNGSPGGANNQIQFNNGGLFDGRPSFTIDPTTSNVSVGNISVATLRASQAFINGPASANSIAIGSDVNNLWNIYGNILEAPTNARWESSPDTLDDYINSAIGGFLNLQSFNPQANLASQIHLEHGLIQITVFDGATSTWEFNESGNLVLPNIANPSITYANGMPFIGNAAIGGVIQGNVPPSSPNDTTLWWDDVTGRLYVWYDDGSGLQWVDAAPAGPPNAYGNSNVSLYLASGNNTAGISTTGNIAGNYFVGNGSLLTGVTSSTGNTGFVGDAIYNLNGILLENADLSHGATASVILPVNGDANSVQINNTYGNIILQAGAASNITGSWTLNNKGTVQSPIISVDTLPSPTTAGLRAFVNDANLIAAGNFGQIVGNVGANVVPVYSDGSDWRIG